MPRFLSPFANERSGAAALELALALPLLVMFGLVTVDVGRIASVSMQIESAARRGASYAATHQYTASSFATWKESIEDVVEDEFATLSNKDVTELATTIEVSAATPSRLARVTVAVRGEFCPIIDWPMVRHALPIERSVTMEQFR